MDTPIHKKQAADIYTSLRSDIEAVTRGTNIPPGFIAGLISVENAGLDPRATRFEPHVFMKLASVRDGFGSYSGITPADLKGVTNNALRNLARSWGLTQIMGWHCIKNLNCTIHQLRSSDHLKYTVKLLKLTCEKHLNACDYATALRIWNTGRPNGNPKLRSPQNPHGTFDVDYVPSALKVMSEYNALTLQEQARQSVPTETTNLHTGLDAETALNPSMDKTMPDNPKPAIDSLTIKGAILMLVAMLLPKFYSSNKVSLDALVDLLVTHGDELALSIVGFCAVLYGRIRASAGTPVRGLIRSKEADQPAEGGARWE